DRLGREHVVAQAIRVGVADLDLLLLLEVVALDAGDAVDHLVEARLVERGAGGDRDAAALADGQLGERLAAHVLEPVPPPLPPPPPSGAGGRGGTASPAATRFGLTSTRPDGLSPSSTRPSRTMSRIFCGS